MDVMKNFSEAQKALFEHVGFTPDWVEYAIDDCTDSIWCIQEPGESIWNNGSQTVRYADTEEAFNSDGDYYCDDIYCQRFYNKWIYEGEDYTMIFCDPHTDGAKWFRVFKNSMRRQP